MNRSGWIARSCLLALAAWSRAALAQAPSTGSCAPAPSARSSSSAEPSSASQLAELYRGFECHFARKEYAASLPYLERACRLTDSPRCLLNLGAVHHALMHCQLARSYYQQYLDRAPYDDAVSAARSALEELERACPQAAAAEAVVAPIAVEPGVIAGSSVSGSPVAGGPVSGSPVSGSPVSGGPVASRAAARSSAARDSGPPSQSMVAGAARGDEQGGATPPAVGEQNRRAGERHVLAWSLLGAGAASLTATVVSAAYGARAERDYEARARANPRGSDAELRSIDARGHRYNRLAIVFGVASTVLVGAGVTLWLTDGSLGEGAGAESGLVPDGAGLSYRGWF